MKVSQNFILRKFETAEIDVPYKQKVTDDDFHKVITLAGPHERSIDVSRCILLSSEIFSRFELCIGLRYLDVSYTSFKNVSILQNCQMLQSLVLCGIDLPTFRNLSNLTSLELLNLNFSTIDDIKPLSHLIKLRSLDLGHTFISSISSIELCTRLEELLLDGTDIKGSQEVTQAMTCLSKLPKLKCASVASTGLLTASDQLRSVVGPSVCIDIKSRKLVWFEAVMRNDIQSVKQLLANGFDVDLAAGPDTNILFLETFRGPYCKQMTPFFDCHHPDPALRPRALHLALFMNHREVLIEIAMNRVLHEGAVWFGPILCEATSLKLEQGPVGTGHGKKVSKTTLSLPEFMKELADKRIMNIVLNLHEIFPVDWRDRCITIVREMQQILKDPKSASKITNSATPLVVSITRHSLNQKTSREALEAAHQNNVMVEDSKWALHPMVMKMRKPVVLPVTNVFGNSRGHAPRKIMESNDSELLPRPGTGTSRQRTPLATSRTQTMLGPKSYWLESKAAALREKARHSEMVAEQKSQRVKAMRELLARLSPLRVTDMEDEEKEPWEIAHVTHDQPVTERKDAFLELLHQKAEQAKAASAKKRNFRRK